MALVIARTGIQNYAPGGSARLKLLLIGGPGAGKTRMSSYWPKPIYGDCEGGLASVADREMPYATIKNSKDMLDFLVFLKQESSKPAGSRTYETVVIDTLDAFMRKVKDEWLAANPSSQSFRGFDAWGYLDTKMQMLMTRLLNLDMNIIVNVHYKDKTIKEGSGETATERQELMLQLQGDIKDTAFNDFDLVGWMGTYFVAEDGQRVQKRGLTFKPTPEKPFLKDRLHVTKPWMEVNFSDDDYTNLFMAFVERLDSLGEGGEIGIIPDSEPEAAAALGVVQPMSGGALPPMDPGEIPLEQEQVTTIRTMARDLAKQLGDPAPKSNKLKAELIEYIRESREKLRQNAATAVEESVSTPVAANAETPETVPPAAPAAPAPTVEASTVETTPAPVASAEAPVETHASVASPPEAAQAATQVDAVREAMANVAGVNQGVDPWTSSAEAPAPEPAPTPPAVASTPVAVEAPAAPAAEELAAQVAGADDRITETQALETVQSVLGGTVVSDTPNVETPEVAAPAAAAAPPVAAPAASDMGVCEEPGCAVDLSTQVPDKVKLSYIKFRKKYCEEHFQQHKKAA